MTKQDLTACFGNLNPPGKFLALLSFERDVANKQYFSRGFESDLSPEKYALKTWSEAPEFLASLWIFAQADGTGSLYAFWTPEGEVDLDAVPIVVFGSEGGAYVVARNFDELLRILTFDCEPMIDHRKVYYYRAKDDKPSAMSTPFHKWLKSEYGLDATDSADRIVAEAQDLCGARFQAWMAKFCRN